METYGALWSKKNFRDALSRLKRGFDSPRERQSTA
jgi:hypothetical protein